MEIKRDLSARVQRHGKDGEVREYILLMPDNCSIGEAYDVCFELLNGMLEKAQESAEKAKPKEDPNQNNDQGLIKKG